MKIASLDLGSNTTLMLIAEIKNGQLKQIRDESTVTRMGQEIAQTGKLHVDALKRVDECLANYKKIMDEVGVDKIVSAATSAARDASNNQELYDIAAKYDISIEVIPGSEEAEVTYLGSTFDQPNPEKCFVIDIGGGSTEMVSKDDSGSVRGLSLDMGSVRLIDMFIDQHPVPDNSVSNARKFVDDLIEKNPSLVEMAKGRSAVAVAGTPTTLAMLCQEIEFDENQIHGFRLTLSMVEELGIKLRALSVEERRQLPGMPPKRADVIVAGILILEQVMRKLGFNEVSTSTKGVRYGLALKAAQ